MGALDVLWHVSNLFLPGLMLGWVAAALAKGVWRHELAEVSYVRLGLPASLAAAAMALLGLLVFGQDGRMATYAAMVCACTLVLWWQGFRPRR